MPLTLTYAHHHQCSHKDEIIQDRPNSSNGVTWIVIPTCEETMIELNLIRTEKY